MFWMVSLLAVTFYLGVPASLRATAITLTSGNSSADINTSTSSGMYNWIIDGTDNLFQQWFWYRVGAQRPNVRSIR